MDVALVQNGEKDMLPCRCPKRQELQRAGGKESGDLLLFPENAARVPVRISALGGFWLQLRPDIFLSGHSIVYSRRVFFVPFIMQAAFLFAGFISVTLSILSTFLLEEKE